MMASEASGLATDGLSVAAKHANANAARARRPAVARLRLRMPHAEPEAAPSPHRAGAPGGGIGGCGTSVKRARSGAVASSR